MKSLYLHIGTPKTGTTSIQHFCHDNMEVLEKKGYCYPMFPYSYPNIRVGEPTRNGLFLEAVFRNEEGIRDRGVEAQYLEDGWQRIQTLFQDYDHVIISDEGIWRAAAGRRKHIWRELREQAEKGGFTVKIIAYVRRQDELLESWWNQTVKHGVSQSNKLSWEEYLEVYPKYINLDYHALLKDAADELGVENIIVHRFNRDFFIQGDLLADFLDILGLELTDEYLVSDTSVKNLKMQENFCEIKRIINGMPEVELKDRWRYERMLRNLSDEPDREKGACRMFSAEEAAAFMDGYAGSNQKLYDMFIADGQPLFFEKNDPPPKWERDNPDMLTDLVCFIVACDLGRKRNTETVRRPDSFTVRLKRRVCHFLDRIKNKWLSEEAA